MSIIEVKDLCKSYPDGREVHIVLDHVSYSFEEGEFVAVIGKSGSGKSTLLNLIGGLDSADSGEILVGGEDISRKNDREMSKYRGEKVGFVFQGFHLIPVLFNLQGMEVSGESLTPGIYIVRDSEGNASKRVIR